MARFRPRFAFALAVALAPAAAARADTILYSFTDLGTLGGATSAGLGVNDSAQAVGYSAVNAGTNQNGFLYSAATKMTSAGTLGSGPSSVAFGINASGQIVGYSENNGSSTNGLPAAIPFYTDATGTHAITLPGSAGFGGSGGGEATAINDAGVIAGYGSTAGNAGQHAFIDQNGTITDLGTLGGANSEALAINALGQVVGKSQTATSGSDYVAFAMINGKMTSLGTLGGNASRALGINASGVIVGDSVNAAGATTAFVYANGKMTSLGALAGSFSGAYAINNYGVIVGTTFASGSPSLHAMADYQGIMYDLNKLTALPPGWTLNLATSISTLGYIVGTATDPTGVQHAFLLTPLALGPPNFPPLGGTTPEPSTLALLGVGVVVATLGRKRLRATRA